MDSEKNMNVVLTGCLILLTRQVTCDEISHCYDDVGICLWTNGSQLSQSAAERACRQRNNSFLPRVTDSNIQDKLAPFRTATNRPWRIGSLGNNGFWIGVRAIGINSWHWIDNSSFTGLFAVLGWVF